MSVTSFCDGLDKALRDIETVIRELSANNDEVLSIASQTNMLAENAFCYSFGNTFPKWKKKYAPGNGVIHGPGHYHWNAVPVRL